MMGYKTNSSDALQTAEEKLKALWSHVKLI
jgi:hypothetical protein